MHQDSRKTNGQSVLKRLSKALIGGGRGELVGAWAGLERVMLFASAGGGGEARG